MCLWLLISLQILLVVVVLAGFIYVFYRVDEASIASRKKEDLIGSRFGNLLVRQKITFLSGDVEFLCKCGCGETLFVDQDRLFSKKNDQLCCWHCRQKLLGLSKKTIRDEKSFKFNTNVATPNIIDVQTLADGTRNFKLACFACENGVFTVSEQQYRFTAYRICPNCREERNIKVPEKLSRIGVCSMCSKYATTLKRLDIDGTPLCEYCRRFYKRHTMDED